MPIFANSNEYSNSFINKNINILINKKTHT